MLAKPSLDGIKVLVTRPEKQAKQLCHLLVQAGGDPVAFPVIEIAAINRNQWANIDLTEQDMIIFISRNAVTHFASHISKTILGSVALVSVGTGSADSMREHGLHVDVQPKQALGSEGLLLLPELADVAGKRIVIVRGKGGRELLADALKERGANVQYLEVYQRLLPSPSALLCEQALTVDYLVCTSVEGVKNLTVLLQKGLKNLVDKPMLVISERIKESAVLIGFNHVIVTDDASDHAIIEQLINMETM